MSTDIQLAKHMNMVRMNQTEGKIRRVPDVGYNVFKKNFEEPHMSEGFSDIVKVPFEPNFDNEHDKKLFMQWT